MSSNKELCIICNICIDDANKQQSLQKNGAVRETEQENPKSYTIFDRPGQFIHVECRN
ncbi:hypothetical protein DPMN_138797 [Dreissena polymorpha]|uniref:Uncharacterized protein n=1 Tax=Dreissena polymorpha TaxID=45954 RepID=A0A9D4G8B2_DREPO|nr:hypothetical protein DPMN_138797 [Dreissena polymorpha]